MATKEVNIQVNLQELDRQLRERRERDLLTPQEPGTLVRTTVFSLGKDPRLNTEPVIRPPELRFAEVLRDGLNNPFVRLHWRIHRADVDLVGVKKFEVFRKKIQPLRNIVQFSRVGYDQISQGITRQGRFSFDRKATMQIKPSLIQSSILNARLSEEDRIAKTQLFASFGKKSDFSTRRGTLASPIDTSSLTHKGSFTNFFSDKKVQKIGQVVYSKFLKLQQSRAVAVTDNKYVDLYFDDKSVRFGDAFEYHVVSVPETITSSTQSNKIKLQVEDTTGVAPPQQVLIKQLDSVRARISICINPADEVARAFVFKRSENDFSFEKVASLVNVRNCINLVDTTIQYGVPYTYRVFLENIHGTLSEPVEASLVATFQNTIPLSRSNTFRIPILTTIPDQNSDFVRLTIGANDPKVAYYEVSRRNLTTKQKDFVVPSKDSNYGGAGWVTNKVFVEKERSSISDTTDRKKELFKRQVSVKEINFVDDTVQLDHYYQYSIVGYDLFGNKTSHQLSSVRATGKKTIRSPMNVRAIILRENPFRLKLKWDDDNETTRFTSSEVFKVPNPTDPDDVKLAYKVQRRRLGQSRYESFPLTANQFIVDEEETDDAVSFMPLKQEDTFGSLPNKVPVSSETLLNTLSPAVSVPSLTSISSQSSLIVPGAKTTQLERQSISDIAPQTREPEESRTTQHARPFNMPKFLKRESVYFYRVAAVSQEKNEESNFSDEIKVRVIAALSSPLNLRVKVENVKIRPLIAKLTWETDTQKAKPDKWTVERKVDVQTDTFEFIGSSYLKEEFFDRSIELGKSYIYRVKSFDVIGRESEFFEVRLTV